MKGIFGLILISLALLQPAHAQEGGGITAAEEDGGVIWTNANGELYSNSLVKFTIEPHDPIADIDFIEYKMGGRVFLKYTGPFSIAREGPHSSTYRSVDRTGNREIDRVFNVIIDNTGPDVRVLPNGPFANVAGKLWTAPGNSFTVRAVDPYAGIQTLEYGVNTAHLFEYRRNEIIQLTNSGRQLIRYRATDNLGNQTAGNLQVEVDGARPTVEIKPTRPLIYVGDRPYVRRNTGFKVFAQDQGSGVTGIKVRIDGSGVWRNYSDQTILFDTEGEHSIEAKAIDAVGNESEIVLATFSVNDTPPTSSAEQVSIALYVLSKISTEGSLPPAP